MNAAFLLVAAAWAPGADAAPAAAAAAAPAPVASAPVAGACGGGCGGCGGGCGWQADCGGCCDDCCKPSCLDKLKARFRKHHNKCGDCCDSCNTCNTCCAPAPTCCAPAPTCCAPAPTCCQSSCDCGSSCDCCKPSCLDKLKARFHKHKSCCDSCCDSCGSGCGGCGGGACGGPVGAPAYGPGTMPPAGEPIKAPKDTNPGSKLPDGKTQAPSAPEVVTPASSEVKNPFERSRQDGPRPTRATTSNSLTGQLSFVHADGGMWVLRYASLAKEDPNGGSVVLTRDRQMDTYREGDTVTVEGEIIAPRASVFLGAPLYRVQAIQLVDRPNR